MGIEPEQLAELWRTHAPALRLLARTRCEDAEDALQNAFISLAKQIDLPEDPLAWLVRVVRNHAISVARSEERRKRREAKVAHEKPSWWMSPSDEKTSLPPEELQLAMATLETSLREIVVAHLWTGMSFRQIAAAFDMTSSSVHREYHKGLCQLREALQLSIVLNTETFRPTGGKDR